MDEDHHPDRIDWRRCAFHNDSERQSPGLCAGRIVNRAILLGRLGYGAVFIDPVPAKLNRLGRGQPGPIRTSGPECDPNGVAMHVLFDGDWCRVRHDLALSLTTQTYRGLLPRRYILQKSRQCDFRCRIVDPNSGVAATGILRLFRHSEKYRLCAAGRVIRATVAQAADSKSEHMIQREAAGLVHQAVVAEQPAGRIPHQHVPLRTRRAQASGVEQIMRPYRCRS
jgi:hypothetical protein